MYEVVRYKTHASQCGLCGIWQSSKERYDEFAKPIYINRMDSLRRDLHILSKDNLVFLVKFGTWWVEFE